MTKTEMLDILRGKVLQESPEEIQVRLNEIADELERSERVVRCGECKWSIKDIGKYPRCMMNRDINGDCRMVSEYGFCSYGERKGEVSE